jgi:uncharacterized repeat protein (TIGR03847 family)
MGLSFDFDAPDHFTAGTVGPPGQRVFYLQAQQASQLITLKCEKEQVRALAEYLERLLAALPGGGAEAEDDTGLIEPVEAAWIVSALGAGYDQERDRVLVEARELQEDEEEETSEEPAVGRVALTRAQTAVFIARIRTLVQAGRPICRVCHQPMEPDGHVCPSTNGHVVRPRDA